MTYLFLLLVLKNDVTAMNFLVEILFCEQILCFWLDFVAHGQASHPSHSQLCKAFGVVHCRLLKIFLNRFHLSCFHCCLLD